MRPINPLMHKLLFWGTSFQLDYSLKTLFRHSFFCTIYYKILCILCIFKETMWLQKSFFQLSLMSNGYKNGEKCTKPRTTALTNSNMRTERECKRKVGYLENPFPYHIFFKGTPWYGLHKKKIWTQDTRGEFSKIRDSFRMCLLTANIHMFQKW